MSVYLNTINYDKLIEKSLKHVVIEALKIAEEQGLPGEHHFYITFRTNHPRTNISDQLRQQYPEEMTIVLQHQFSNLMVMDDYFSVELSFGGIPQTLTIPFDAITYFADPHAKFGLSFNISDESFGKPLTHQDIINEIEEPQEEAQKVSNGVAPVISIDAYRKK
mgnify:FL=1